LLSDGCDPTHLAAELGTLAAGMHWPHLLSRSGSTTSSMPVTTVSKATTRAMTDCRPGGNGGRQCWTNLDRAWAFAVPKQHAVLILREVSV
jgi:hypothetical protein